MPEIVPLENAPEAVQDLVAGIGAEPIVFVRDGQPVATLTPSETNPPADSPKRRQPGLLKGWLTIVEEDDEHLEAFKDYMP